MFERIAVNWTFLLILFWLPFTGCSSGGGGGSESEKIQAAATVGMVADIVRNVGGDDVDVVQIMGSGVDPHLYKATRDDVRLIMQSDIVFFSGLMLEGKMIDTLGKLGRSLPVFAVTEALSPDRLIRSGNGGGHEDPHVWMDADAWRGCIASVANGLAEVRPQLSSRFQQRAEAYATKLASLDEYAKQLIASIPAQNRLLITSHDAFNYFGRAYQIEVLGVQGLSTESEAGLQQINSLVDLIVQRRIRAVFVESSVPQKNIRALIDGAAARGHKVIIGGELYSDAMGEPNTYEGTYVGMFEHNVNLVTDALGGEVPPGGFAGWQQRRESNIGASSGNNSTNRSEPRLTSESETPSTSEHEG